MVRIAFCVGQYPEVERKRRIDAALSYATDGVEIGVVDVEADPYVGLGPAEIQQAAGIFHKAFIQAEQEGYDAVVPLGMLDIGVDGGRSLVDIPVIGPAQAALHVAAMLGDRIGLVVYLPEYIPYFRAQVKTFGMEDWIAGYRTVNIPVHGMSDAHDVMVEALLRESRALIEQDGAEVIIPHGITQCPIQVKPDWLAKELGVPVVEGIGAPIRLAAMLAGLGYTQSRIRWPKSEQAKKK
jgi:allantoin racemase